MVVVQGDIFYVICYEHTEEKNYDWSSEIGPRNDSFSTPSMDVFHRYKKAGLKYSN